MLNQMKFFFLIFLALKAFPSYGNDYLFVLQCDSEDKRDSAHPFIFIGKPKGQDSLIIYLKSNGKIFTYKGGESKILKLKKETLEFYEYEFRQQETPIQKKSISYYSLDRSSLRLSEKSTVFEKDATPIYGGYQCKKAPNQKQSFDESINLKRKFDAGAYNKI